MHVSHCIELDVNQVNLVFYILGVFLLESLVGEHKLASSLFKDCFAETIKVVVIEFTAKNVLIDPLAELNNSLEFSACDVVLLGVGLSHHEHLVVLLPEGHEIRVLLDNQVHNIQGGQDLTKVIKDFMVDHLLEAIEIHSVLRVKEPIHLIHDVLGQINNSPDHVEELVIYLERPTNLKLLLPNFRTIFTEVFHYKS